MGKVLDFCKLQLYYEFTGVYMPGGGIQRQGRGFNLPLKKGKLILLVSSISILIFFTISKISFSTKESSRVVLMKEEIPSSKENKESSKAGSLSEDQQGKDPSLVKMDLLKRNMDAGGQNVGNASRNIFNKYPYDPVQRASEKNETSPKAKEEIKEDGKNEPDSTPPPINFKLIGIIGMPKSRQPQDGFINHAILSGNGIQVVKKGDVLNGRYEILNVNSDNIEIRDMELNKTETLSLEKEP